MQQDLLKYKSLGILICIAVVLLIGVSLVDSLVFGSVRPYVLQEAKPLYGRIAQELAPTDGGPTPTPEEDFLLTNTTYFEDNTWVVTGIKFLPEGRLDGGLVVLEKTDGVFNVVLGPSTSFDSLSVDELPVSVGSYIKNNGLVYEPVY